MARTYLESLTKTGSYSRIAGRINQIEAIKRVVERFTAKQRETLNCSSRTNIPKINLPALLSFQTTLPPFGEQLQLDTIVQRNREIKYHRLAASKAADN